MGKIVHPCANVRSFIFIWNIPVGATFIMHKSYRNNQQDATVQLPATTNYVKLEAAITVFELLMMSGVLLETC